jgi:galactonate dehydratase
VIPGDPAQVLMQGFGGGLGTTDQVVTPALIRAIEHLIGTFREAVGVDVDICLDLNFNFKTEACLRIAKAVEPFSLLWLEIDMYDPDALLQIKQSTTTRICSGENLYTLRGYRPYFEKHALDVATIDVPWNGFTQSKKVADLAESYEINIAPHNYYSHLSTLMSAHLCATIPNVRIMEIDIDDVPWKDDIVTEPLDIKDGYLRMPTRPGWGADLNEREIAKHPWEH